MVGMGGAGLRECQHQRPVGRRGAFVRAGAGDDRTQPVGRHTRARAPEEVAQSRDVGDAHRLLIDGGPGVGIGIQRKKVGIAVSRKDGLLQDVRHGVSGSLG